MTGQRWQVRDNGLLVRTMGGFKELQMGVEEPPNSFESYVRGDRLIGGVNVGPRIKAADRTNYSGNITNVGPGDVVSGLNLTGRYQPNRNGAIIRDTLITQPAPAGGSNNSTAQTQLAINYTNNVSPYTAETHLMEFCEIDPAFSTHDAYAVQGGGFTASRCWIHGSVDGFVVHGGGGVPKGVKLFDCLVSGLESYAIDPRQGGGPSHGDAVQSEGNLALLWIMGCELYGGTTSCILFTNNVAGGYSDVKVHDNYLHVLPTGGSGINLSAANIVNFEIFRNKMDRGTPIRINVAVTNRTASKFGMTGTTGSTTGWVPDGSGNHNYYDDDGSYVLPRNG